MLLYYFVMNHNLQKGTVEIIKVKSFFLEHLNKNTNTFLISKAWHALMLTQTQTAKDLAKRIKVAVIDLCSPLIQVDHHLCRRRPCTTTVRLIHPSRQPASFQL